MTIAEYIRPRWAVWVEASPGGGVYPVADLAPHVRADEREHGAESLPERDGRDDCDRDRRVYD
jgi:hypothetical protein